MTATDKDASTSSLLQTSLTFDTASALLVALLTSALYVRETEIWSEIFCWVLVLLLLETIRGFRDAPEDIDSEAADVPPPWLDWTIAGGLTVACLCKATFDVRWMFPLLTPCILAFRHYNDPGELPSNERTAELRIVAYMSTSIPGTTVIAIISTVFLASALSFLSFIPSLISVGAHLATYLGLIRLLDSHAGSGPSINLEKTVQRIATRTLGLLLISVVVQLSTGNAPSVEARTVTASAVLKTLRWFLLFRITQRSPWDVATTIDTFGFASVGTSAYVQRITTSRAFLRSLVSCLALGQTINILPKFAREKWLLWTFQSVPILVLLLRSSPGFQSAESLNDFLWGASLQHPVEKIIKNAQSDFSAMIKRQSRSYDNTVKDYVRRYHRSPPEGFEDWYKFAKDSNSTVIDDFDIIYDRLAPFWKISGEQFRKSIDEAANDAMMDFWRCGFEKGEPNGDCHQYGDTINRLSEPWRHRLPDLELAVNALDEPSLLFPADAPRPEQFDGSEMIRWIDHSRSPNWDEIISTCENVTTSVKTSAKGHVKTFGIPFVQNVRSSLDLCAHPEYEKLHGFWVSPATFRYSKQVVPLLSQSATSTMRDILYPPPGYLSEDNQYNEEDDVEWKDKQKALYWAGSNTGGFALNEDWHLFHRHRFVKLANNLEPQNIQYLKNDSRQWEVYNSSTVDTSKYEVFFTAVIQCEDGPTSQCPGQQDYFPTRERAERTDPYKYQLNMDIDGNGMSGRFYRLLASKSLTFKVTAFKEWHDDRLFPWVHYVPVSLGMEELPELVRYFTSPEGEKQAQHIAEQGRQWHASSLRDVDQSVYLYRLFLELSRLQDPTREAEDPRMRAPEPE